jgi:hypothetical protein
MGYANLDTEEVVRVHSGLPFNNILSAETAFAPRQENDILNAEQASEVVPGGGVYFLATRFFHCYRQICPLQ